MYVCCVVVHLRPSLESLMWFSCNIKFKPFKRSRKMCGDMENEMREFGLHTSYVGGRGCGDVRWNWE